MPPVFQDHSALTHNLVGLAGFGGATALRDAVAKGVQELSTSPPGRARILVLFTDGLENASLEPSWTAVFRRTREGRVSIHTIGYGDVDEEVLRMISDRTGGTSHFLAIGESLPPVLKGVVLKTAVYYRARYKPCPDLDERQLLVTTRLFDTEFSASYSYEQVEPRFPEDTEPKTLVLFAFDDANLGRARYDEERLLQVAEFLRGRSDLRMVLTGFTDSRGADLLNKQLGHRRALAVAEWLHGHGVPRDQVSVRSEGRNRLLFEPDYPDENKAAQNRRVEFRLEPRGR